MERDEDLINKKNICVYVYIYIYVYFFPVPFSFLIIDSPDCPCKTNHTNNRPFDISVRKVKVRKRNAGEQCT